MPAITVASRTFSSDDQAVFGSLTGDLNPIHMDPVAARRTQAGAVVVHGIHAILWALDKLVELDTIKQQVVSLNVQFTNFITVGSQLELKLMDQNERSIRTQLSIGRLKVATLVVTLGSRREIGEIELPDSAPKMIPSDQPAHFDRIEELANLHGSMDVVSPVGKIQQYFPHASSVIGGSRVTAIALLSPLVGMICPGLYSLFGGFLVNLIDHPRNQDRIGFEVTESDERFRMVRMNISGAGICGSVQAFLRYPPITQPSISGIMNIVSPTEFIGSTSLIIGGSRGLGALTAKILAAGGGNVIVTYAVGHSDAAELTEEIRRHTMNTNCYALRYDALNDAASQLRDLKASVTHLYYFATRSIARQKDNSFVPSLLDEFIQMYVKGFYDCCSYLGEHASQPITAFYPSSVFVESNPPGMTEYTMAKMAGEILCANMNRATGKIHAIVSRLPRLLTDQTATILSVEKADPLRVMLPVVRKVQTSGQNIKRLA
jgi:acyl dehydratase